MSYVSQWVYSTVSSMLVTDEIMITLLLVAIFVNNLNYLFNIQNISPTSKFSYQHRQNVTNLKSLTSL